MYFINIKEASKILQEIKYGTKYYISQYIAIKTRLRTYEYSKPKEIIIKHKII